MIRKVTLAFVFVGMAGLLPINAADEAKDAVKKDIELPKNPKAAVITLDSKTKGGRRQAPLLVIREDRTVVVNGNTSEKKMEEKDLQDLLRFIIEENKFFELPDQLARKVDRTEQPIQVIRIQAAGKKYTSECYGSSKDSDAKAPSFQAVHDRLTKIMESPPK